MSLKYETRYSYYCHPQRDSFIRSIMQEILSKTTIFTTICVCGGRNFCPYKPSENRSPVCLSFVFKVMNYKMSFHCTQFLLYCSQDFITSEVQKWSKIKQILEYKARCPFFVRRRINIVTSHTKTSLF